MTVLVNYHVYRINILPEGLFTIACLKRSQTERYAFNFCTNLCMFFNVGSHLQRYKLSLY